MQRTFSSIDKIRAELAWVNETPDLNKCAFRTLRCCEETGHKAGACMGAFITLGRDSMTHSGRNFINFAALAPFFSPVTCFARTLERHPG